MPMRRSTDPFAQRGHPLRRAIAVERAPRRDDDGDLKLFALSFTAFFICFYTFLM